MWASVTRSLWVRILGLAVLSASCSQASVQRGEALASSRVVTFRTTDGIELSGRLFGPANASAGLVLAHMLPADQSSWYALAGHLADGGYRVLTFDFRGYCPGGDAGCSGGTKQVEAAPTDLQAAVDFLRSRGADRIGLIGASMGGTAAIDVAAIEGAQVDVVITLSAPQVLGGLSAGPEQLQTATAAKLFLAGLGDGVAAQAAQAFYDASLQPKRVEILTTDDHGTDMLTGGQGQRVRDLIDLWLTTQMPADAAGAASGVPTP